RGQLSPKTGLPLAGDNEPIDISSTKTSGNAHSRLSVFSHFLRHHVVERVVQMRQRNIENNFSDWINAGRFVRLRGTSLFLRLRGSNEGELIAFLIAARHLLPSSFTGKLPTCGQQRVQLRPFVTEQHGRFSPT